MGHKKANHNKMETLVSDPLNILDTRNGRAILTLQLPPRGIATKDLYDALNRAVQPFKALIFSKDSGKPTEVYHKPRTSGGNYALKVVSVYPEGYNPYDMIDKKLLFKAEKRSSRIHNSKVLAGMVGKALYQKSPATFLALANHEIEKMDKPAFWGGQPRTELQMSQLTRHLSANGPQYREAPFRFFPNAKEIEAMRDKLSN